jgi:hypothetical protein
MFQIQCTCIAVTYSPVVQEGDPKLYLQTLEVDCSSTIPCIKQESSRNRYQTEHKHARRLGHTAHTYSTGTKPICTFTMLRT